MSYIRYIYINLYTYKYIYHIISIDIQIFMPPCLSMIHLFGKKNEAGRMSPDEPWALARETLLNNRYGTPKMEVWK